VSVSGDGQVMVAAVSSGPLYVSFDGGNSWQEQTSTGSHEWKRVILSRDGKTVVALMANERNLFVGRR
jgi:hypothetical protein